MAAKKTPRTPVPASPAKQVRQAKPSPAPKAEQPPSAAQGAKLSALDAAARVLGETGQALTCKELIERMAAQGYWTSPGGKTPQATLYAAMLRERKTKGASARFQKTERGKFALVSSSGQE